MRQAAVFCLLALTRVAFAQTCPVAGADTVQGGFAINLGDRFCVGSNVALTNSANVQGVQYWHQYTGTAIPTTGGSTSATFRYNQPGKFLIIQRGKLNGREAYACKVVEVLAAPPPVFTTVSCSPGQVTLTIPENAANIYDEYDVNWGVAGRPVQTIGRAQTPIRFTYPTTGTTYTLSVRGAYQPTRCGSTSGSTVTPTGLPPVPQRPDLIRLELTGPTTATLTLSRFSNGSVEVFQRPPVGTFLSTGEKLATSASSNVVQLKNLNNQAQTCFKATLTNLCDQTQDTPELCSLPLRVTPQNQRNEITWTPLPTPSPGVVFRDYTLRRNGVVWNPVETSIATNRRTDAPVRCGETYEYQLTARVGAMESVSEKKSVKGLSTVTPPALTAFESTVTNDRVALTWVAPPAGTPPNDGIRKYTLTRAVGGGASQTLADSLAAGTTGFTDPSAQPSSQTYCYVLTYTDVCGNQAPPTAPTCPVLLRQDRGVLDWTAYQGFGGGPVAYTVEEIGGGTQAVGAALRYEPDPNALSGQEVRFRIRASGPGGQVSYSNVVDFSLAMSLLVPQAFSPNGDGLNDRFEVKGLFIQSFRMKIFNRWGAPVFATDDRAEGWDGLVGGAPAPEGWYAYQLDVTDFRGNPFQKRGGVLLMR